METIVSGMRPTGRLHLGHLHGALKNWLKLQEQYQCYFFVADWHALTTDYATPQGIQQSTIEMVMDWLSVGLDPAKSVLFRQSRVKEHAELHLIYSMITPVPWLERNPTYKEQIKEIVGKDLSTYGFLGYPVLQAADITIYKANKVPVGVDQAPHVELTREIVRRFNQLYRPIFPEPEVLLTETQKVPGLDGRKMSKSYGNAVFLSDTPQGDRSEAQPHDDRPGARAAHRSGRTGKVPGVSTAQDLLHPGRNRPSFAGLPHRRHRLPGMQESHDQACDRGSGAVSREARALSGQARRGRRDTCSREPDSAQSSRRGDHDRSERNIRTVSTRVQLEIFEGPLDLLLHLIKKNEVSITDIPIATITEQYLATLELMQTFSLDVAGEFLVMAATLIHIKSRMLLPAGDEESR